MRPRTSISRFSDKVARSLASSSVVCLLLFSSAGLLHVTSSRAVFALGPTPEVTAAHVTPDKENQKDDDDDDDDDNDDDKFSQPVRVGDLIGRDVIAPVESQDLLGHVRRIVQNGDAMTIVMSHGGYFGFGSHLVCVAADALALTGQALQAKDVSPADLDGLPVCDGGSDAPLDANAIIKMNVSKPSH